MPSKEESGWVAWCGGLLFEDKRMSYEVKVVCIIKTFKALTRERIVSLMNDAIWGVEEFRDVLMLECEIEGGDLQPLAKEAPGEYQYVRRMPSEETRMATEDYMSERVSIEGERR